MQKRSHLNIVEHIANSGFEQQFRALFRRMPTLLERHTQSVQVTTGVICESPVIFQAFHNDLRFVVGPFLRLRIRITRPGILFAELPFVPIADFMVRDQLVAEVLKWTAVSMRRYRLGFQKAVNVRSGPGCPSTAKVVAHATPATECQYFLTKLLSGATTWEALKPRVDQWRYQYLQEVLTALMLRKGRSTTCHVA